MQQETRLWMASPGLNYLVLDARFLALLLGHEVVTKETSPQEVAPACMSPFIPSCLIISIDPFLHTYFSEYDFFTFNSISNSVTVTTLVSPSLNAYSTNRPVAIAIQVDSQPPQTKQFIPPAVPGQLPGAWGGLDGFVANSIVSVVTKFQAAPGAHTLKVSRIRFAKIHVFANGLF